MFIKVAGIEPVSPEKCQIQYLKITHLNHWVFVSRGLFCSVLGLLRDRRRLKIDTDVRVL